MKKVVFAFLLGLVAFPVLMFVGETWGLFPAFAALAVLFFVCQFLLSRDNPNALWRDWPIMLALNAVMIVSVVIMSMVEEREVVLSQGPGILLGCCCGTLAGALTASRVARSAPPQR